MVQNADSRLTSRKKFDFIYLNTRETPCVGWEQYLAMEEFWTNFLRVMSVIRILMHEKSNRLIEKKKTFFFYIYTKLLHLYMNQRT